MVQDYNYITFMDYSPVQKISHLEAKLNETPSKNILSLQNQILSQLRDIKQSILLNDKIELNKNYQASQTYSTKPIKNHYHFHLPAKKNIIFDLITKCFKNTDIISIQYSQRFGKDTNQAIISVDSLRQEDVDETIQKLMEQKYVFEKADLIDVFF